MWTSKNRARYDRSKLRYPSDLTDDEWGLVEPLIPPGTPRLNPPHAQNYAIQPEVSGRTLKCPKLNLEVS